MAASPGIAPGPSVSETDALLITPRGPPSRFALRRGKRLARRAVAGRRRLVAREGPAPPISGCRPDVMLFHHRAFRMRNSECGVRSAKRERRLLVRAPPFRTLHSPLRTGNGCLAWIRTKIIGVKARHAAVTPRGKESACQAVARHVTNARLRTSVLRRSSPRHPSRVWRRLVEPEVVATSPNPIKSRVPVCCGFGSRKMVGERGFAPPRLTDSRSVGSANSL